MTELLRRHWYGLHWPLPPHMPVGGTAFGITDDLPRGDHMETSIAAAVAAERAGMDGILCADATDWYVPGSVWDGDLADTLAEATDPHAVFTSEPIIAAAGTVTENLEFLWGPVDCVRRAPVNIAHMVLTLDHVTKGRTSVVLAQGQIDHMRQTGISRIGAKDKLWDGVQIVRQLIRDTEPFAFRGRVWKFDRGALMTPYYGEKAPDVLVAGMTDETLELVARFADGWLVPLPAGGIEYFSQRVRTLRETAERYGRDPNALRLYGYLSCFMMNDEALLEEALDHPLAKWNSYLAGPQALHSLGLSHPESGDFNYMKDIVPEWYSRKAFDDATSRVSREAARILNFYGSAKDVIEQVEPYLELGITDVMFYNTAGMGGTEHAAAAHEADVELQSALGNRPVSRRAFGA
jgi:phthiodiolone/phenolphthiodiolone dimycocerosates ketoreductase